MSERGQRHQRKYWREKQAALCLRKAHLLASTSPPIPEPGPYHEHMVSVNKKLDVNGYLEIEVNL